ELAKDAHLARPRIAVIGDKTVPGQDGAGRPRDAGRVTAGGAGVRRGPGKTCAQSAESNCSGDRLHQTSPRDPGPSSLHDILASVMTWRRRAADEATSRRRSNPLAANRPGRADSLRVAMDLAGPGVFQDRRRLGLAFHAVDHDHVAPGAHLL